MWFWDIWNNIEEVRWSSRLTEFATSAVFSVVVVAGAAAAVVVVAARGAASIVSVAAVVIAGFAVAVVADAAVAVWSAPNIAGSRVFRLPCIF